MRVVLLSTFFLFCLSCKSRVENQLSAGERKFRDFTTVWDLVDFDKEWSKVRAGIKLDYDVILIPGFLSNAVIKLGKVQKNLLSSVEKIVNKHKLPKTAEFLVKKLLLERLKGAGTAGYYDDQLKFFTNEKVPGYRLKIESENLPQENAKTIAKAIGRSCNDGRKVILITHSKGGLDSLHALLNDQDKAKKCVGGWIALQSAFGGSPVADAFVDRKFLDIGTSLILEQVFGGNKRALTSLSTKTSRDFLDKNKKAIRKLLDQVPSINYASNTDDDTTLFFPKKLIDKAYKNGTAKPYDETKKYLGNDGLVAVRDAWLPGLGPDEWIYGLNIDHAAPVMKANRNLDRVKFTKVLMIMIWERIQAKKTRT